MLSNLLLYVSPLNEPLPSILHFKMVRLALSLLLTTSAASSFAYIQYSTVTGYFVQDVNSTNATTFDYVREKIDGILFGKISDTRFFL